jgi:hypothetical protein
MLARQVAVTITADSRFGLNLIWLITFNSSYSVNEFEFGEFYPSLTHDSAHKTYLFKLFFEKILNGKAEGKSRSDFLNPPLLISKIGQPQTKALYKRLIGHCILNVKPLLKYIYKGVMKTNFDKITDFVEVVFIE